MYIYEKTCLLYISNSEAHLKYNSNKSVRNQICTRRPCNSLSDENKVYQWLNQVPNGQILDVTKLRAFADDKLKVAK